MLHIFHRTICERQALVGDDSAPAQRTVQCAAGGLTSREPNCWWRRTRTFTSCLKRLRPQEIRERFSDPDARELAVLGVNKTGISSSQCIPCEGSSRVKLVNGTYVTAAFLRSSELRAKQKSNTARVVATWFSPHLPALNLVSRTLTMSSPGSAGFFFFRLLASIKEIVQWKFFFTFMKHSLSRFPTTDDSYQCFFALTKTVARLLLRP